MCASKPAFVKSSHKWDITETENVCPRNCIVQQIFSLGLCFYWIQALMQITNRFTRHTVDSHFRMSSECDVTYLKAALYLYVSFVDSAFKLSLAVAIYRSVWYINILHQPCCIALQHKLMQYSNISISCCISYSINLIWCTRRKCKSSSQLCMSIRTCKEQYVNHITCSSIEQPCMVPWSTQMLQHQPYTYT